MTTGPDTSGSSERLRRLQAVTDAALSHLDVENLLVELLDRVRELLNVDTATVLLLDPSGQQLVATAARGLEEEVRQGVRIPVGVGFAGRVAAGGQPVRIEHVDPTNVVNPILLDKGIASMLGVPMIAAGRVIGVLHVGTLTPRWFSDDDVDLLQRVADRVSLATQARLASIDRATTVALQRSLLPGRLGAIDGVDVAARYVPGAEVGVGGDWYDLFALPSGHVGAVIGDVAGNGLQAAVVMSRIRSALRAYALESNDPADVLARLDRKIQLFEPDAMATVAYAVLDPTRKQATMSVAGHLPPVLVEPGRPTRLLDVPVDLPLGAYPNTRRRTVDVPLTHDSLVLFYTDGLIERPTRPIDEGLELLVGALTPGSAERVCATVMAALIGDQPTKDDVAILALHTDYQ
ncbi:SpoIIE family protein phosphatase [Planosporangium flavigriseum]|uniref:PP2C family protein-serine/threonine phosphatase n=1 Tax=Planosporangium flavigriseum TaxID=373681 RepID=UPI001439FB17|nr:GAF domain-containing SpoIIE family protein phosphatase [Planosporangium flavigriseum]NJC66659.1 SpoIIE family protein phosphatase [Planosporangium flavigriseum]